MATGYRNGSTDPRFAPWLAGYSINLWDACFIDTTTTNHNIKSAVNFPWQSAVATPTAPTLADGAQAIGTVLTNSSTHVKVSYQFPWGEGALSGATAVTPTLHAAIRLTGVSLPPPATGLNVYVETSAGSGVYQLWNTFTFPSQTAQGIGGITAGLGDILITGYGTGQVPWAGNPGGAAVSTTALTITQYYFGLSYCGQAAQVFNTNNQIAYGIKDGNLRYDTAGNFDFPVVTATEFFNGQYIGLGEINATPSLDPQNVVLVSHPLLGIGKVNNVQNVNVVNAASNVVQASIFPRLSGIAM